MTLVNEKVTSTKHIHSKTYFRVIENVEEMILTTSKSLPKIFELIVNTIHC